MHDKSFDFSDGDLVLSASGNTGDDEAVAVAVEAANLTPAAVVYFRIHEALLIEQPSMFTDMFDVVNPSFSEQDLYDGVPFIALHESCKRVSQSTIQTRVSRLSLMPSDPKVIDVRLTKDRFPAPLSSPISQAADGPAFAGH